MSADLSTFIELEGTQKELKAMIMVIKDYCGNKHDSRLEYTIIGRKKKFDGKNDVLLDGLTNKAIDEFLTASKKKIYVEAYGPYGKYGRVDEAGLFEAIAEAAPKAKFKAETNGFTTGQEDNLTGDLKKGKLYITYRFLDDLSFSDEDEGDSDENWFTEKRIYDPIKKEYIREHSEEEFAREMMTRLPLTEFQSIFGLSKVEISSEKYHDYILECYYSYQFPKMDYIDFKFTFPDAEIEQEEFNQSVLKVIEKYGLESYEDYCR